MANGGGDGGDGDVIHGKDGLGVSGDFFKPLFIGYGLQDELEVEGKGQVILAEVDEGDNVFFLSKEVAKVDSGGGEGSGVEGRHGKMRRLVRRKLVGLVASVRQLSEDLTADVSSFYNLGEPWRHSSSCFLVPMFRQSIPSILPNTDSFCLVSCDL